MHQNAAVSIAVRGVLPVINKLNLSLRLIAHCFSICADMLISGF